MSQGATKSDAGGETQSHTPADAGKRRRKPGALANDTGGAPSSPTPGVPMQSVAGNFALQSLFAPQTSTSAPNSSSAEWSFDPYAEDLAAFTNGDLLDAVQYTDAWLRDNGIVHLDRDAYAIRQGRLDAECKRRMQMGHLWLGFAHAQQSFALYQTIPGKNGASDVVAVENDALVHGPATDIVDRPIMTEGQLQSSLDANGVPTVSAADYERALADSQADYSFDDALAPVQGLSGAVSRSNVRANLLQDAYALSNASARQGALAEVYFGTSRSTGYGFGAFDYNALPWTHPTRGVESGNFPVADFRTLFGGTMPESSVKSSTVAGTDPFKRYATYLRGFAEMMNTEPDYRGFDHYMNNASRGRTAAQVRDQLSLIINADDVADFQRFVQDPFGRQTTPSGRPARDLNYQRPALMRIYDGVLQDRPLVLPDGTTINSVAALDAALGNDTVSAAQHRTAITDAANTAAAKVAPNPDLTRAALATFAAARARVPGTMTSRDVRAALSPEYMHSLGRGGGLRGDLHAVRSYGRKGAALGALFGIGHEYFTGSGKPDAFERLAWAGGREGLRGGATASLETLSASRASQYIIARGLAAGSGRALAARLGARFGPAGLVEGAFEVGSMLNDDRPNRPGEVSYRMGRAFVIGGTSALAGSAVGAKVGSAIGTAVLPGVGTVVGFIAGLLVGALVGVILNELIPSYEKMVMDQVPLREFEKNIEAQSPFSIQNQVLAEQELELLTAFAHNPATRGPYVMADVLTRRNLSTDPGERMVAEALIYDQIHGGCQDCHTRTESSYRAAGIPRDSEARIAPIDRMYLAALEQSQISGERPKFLNRYDMLGETVPQGLQEQMAYDPTAAVIMNSINVIQPNLKAWREAVPKGADTIPMHAINSPLNEQQLYDKIRSNIDREQGFFEWWFGPVGDAEYRMYEDMLKEAEEEQKRNGQ